MTTADKIHEATYHLRQANSADGEFLLMLYAQQRAAELDICGMNTAQRQIFVQIQFNARQSSYATYYPTASDQIISLEDGTSIGRVLVDRTAHGMCLVDIVLLQERQRQGIGTKVIRSLQRECKDSRWQLKLKVAKGSAAERFYRRLGFQLTDEDPFRRQMVWIGSLEDADNEPTAGRQLC
ncbi:GNAT family N-acetyltransferase [Granulicella sp. dw_53]|uniref:GNAT family N-acetyltransferase n=1 Tax=Granulicella sp. dw_53 TaxID=2719792 RepID=UPI001BD5D9D5|nr:GNAT family N-acetyltransferase [Granulicella sp. dw_53]